MAEDYLRVRRDIWSLTEEDPWHPMILAYALAVREMQTRSDDDPTGWSYQAAVHGVAPGVPSDQWRNQCQHNTWFFLPWHRMYLYWFERMVRATVQGLDQIPQETKTAWALPYWNYDRGGTTSTLPPAFREESLPDGSSNPLSLQQRDAALRAGGSIPQQLTSAATALSYTSFAELATPGRDAGFGGPVTQWHHFNELTTTRGALEQTPHNTVHGAVGGPGGFMSRFDTAPLDPVFWLHHGNIDRLWTVWLGQQGGRANPLDPAWGDFEFDFHDESAQPVKSTPGQVVEVEQLGYTYEEVSLEAGLEMAAVGSGTPQDRSPRSTAPAELVGATDDVLELTGEEASVDLAVGTTAAGRSLESAGASPQRVYLNVEDVQGDVNPGLSYGVYLSAPGHDDSHHVGNVSFFGIELASDPGQEHGAAHALRQTFDITDAMAALRDAGVSDPNQVSVSFVPLRPTPPPGLEAHEVAEEVPPVRVGRVSIFVG